MENKLKKPSDYPQIYFRINAEEKMRLENLIEQIMKYRLKMRSKDSKLPKRNELMTEALMVGLEQIKKRIK